jgi:hypothetical protein
MKIEYKSTNNYYVQTTRDSELILNAELSHPLVDPPTVGSAFLLGLSVCMPIIIMIIAVVVTTKSTTRLHALHASLCGFVLAVALVEGGTQLLCTVWVYLGKQKVCIHRSQLVLSVGSFQFGLQWNDVPGLVWSRTIASVFAFVLGTEANIGVGSCDCAIVNCSLGWSESTRGQMASSK